MAKKIADVMTRNPITLPADATIVEAAQKMRDADVGPIIVLDKDKVSGIVTDRDITVRAVAEGRDPKSVKLSQIVSGGNVETVSPDEPVETAIEKMKQRAVRRLPVVQDGKPVGIVSLGDLAQTRDPNSALGEISSAAPNN
jgi:CBS domain-containing protein